MVLVNVEIGLAVPVIADWKLEPAADERLTRHVKLDLESG
jgi:hypothetical protein